MPRLSSRLIVQGDRPSAPGIALTPSPRRGDTDSCYDDLPRAGLFRHEWEVVSGQSFDPWAEIITIIGLLDGYRKHRPAERGRYEIEELLDRAVTDIGA